MARSTYLGTDDHYVFVAPQGAHRNPTKAVTIRFWDSEVGGTQYTDLLVDGEPATEVVIPATKAGNPPFVEGPEGVNDGMWMDAFEGDAAPGPRVFTTSSRPLTEAKAHTDARVNALTAADIGAQAAATLNADVAALPAVTAKLDKSEATATYAPVGGPGYEAKPNTNKSAGLVDWSHNSDTGYLLHLKTRGNTTGSTALLGLGTDQGTGSAILISHKNGGAGLTITGNPGCGTVQSVDHFSSSLASATVIHPGAGPVVVQAGSGAGFADGATTDGSTTLTSATANFTAADVGQSITQLTSRALSDPDGCIPSGTTISAVTNATTVTLSKPAGATGSGILFRVAGRAPAATQQLVKTLDSDGTTLKRETRGGVEYFGADPATPVFRATGANGQTSNVAEWFIYGNGTAALQVQPTGRVRGEFSARFGNPGYTSQPVLQLVNASTTAPTLYLQAAASQGGDQIAFVDSGGTTQSRFNKAGYFVTKKQAAPADADLNAGEMAVWFDSTNGAAKLMVKAKQADGTVKTGSVALA